MSIYLSGSEKDTKQFAAEALERYQNNLERRALLFALHGELGTGKTTFAKGIGEYLGIKRPVRSPGYVLVTEYSYSQPVDSLTRRSNPSGLGTSNPKGLKPDGFSSAGKLFHIDLWRTEGEDEVRALKIEEMIQPGNIILIEWAQKIPKFIDELRRRGGLEVVLVRFSHCGEGKRRIEVINS